MTANIADIFDIKHHVKSAIKCLQNAIQKCITLDKAVTIDGEGESMRDDIER
jgi:hypothetical protein